jgi:hypothetical protein
MSIFDHDYIFFLGDLNYRLDAKAVSYNHIEEELLKDIPNFDGILIVYIYNRQFSVTCI